MRILEQAKGTHVWVVYATLERLKRVPVLPRVARPPTVVIPQPLVAGCSTSTVGATPQLSVIEMGRFLGPDAGLPGGARVQRVWPLPRSPRALGEGSRRVLGCGRSSCRTSVYI